MQFQLIFRNAHSDRVELHDVGHDEPTVAGQVITDGEVVAINGSLWRATRLDTRESPGSSSRPPTAHPS